MDGTWLQGAEDERARAVAMLRSWSANVNPTVSREVSGAMSQAWEIAADALERQVHWREPQAMQAGTS